MESARRYWIGASAAGVIVVVAIAWLLLRDNDSPGHDLPPVISQVGDWMRHEGECDEFTIEASPIPVGPHGPPGTFFQLYGEIPTLGALASCGGGINGFVGWFRFPSPKTLRLTTTRLPGLTAGELTCTRGPELLIDSLFGSTNPRFATLCRELNFTVHQPSG
jgi:hypothetical protein